MRYIEPFAGGLNVFFRLINENRPTATLIKWHGGKYFLAKKIIDCFPVKSFDSYHLSDINPELINIYKCLKDITTAKYIRHFLDLVPYSEEEFESAKKEIAEAPDKLFTYDYWQLAVKSLIVNRMSRGGLGKTYAWSQRFRRGMPEQISAWNTFKQNLPWFADKLSLLSVHIKCENALKVLDEIKDDPNVLSYNDPPYLHDTRTVKNAYTYEMDDFQHRCFLQLCLKQKGKVIISGYKNELYDSLLKDWNMVGWDVPNNSGQNRVKQRRFECVWMNY